jgi:hypothetical protein
MVVMVIRELMAMTKARLTLNPTPSVTCRVKLKVPSAVGAPEIDPAEPSASPVGSAPETMAPEIGGVPPDPGNLNE